MYCICTAYKSKMFHSQNVILKRNVSWIPTPSSVIDPSEVKHMVNIACWLDNHRIKVDFTCIPLGNKVCENKWWLPQKTYRKEKINELWIITQVAITGTFKAENWLKSIMWRNVWYECKLPKEHISDAVILFRIGIPCHTLCILSFHKKFNSKLHL